MERIFALTNPFKQLLASHLLELNASSILDFLVEHKMQKKCTTSQTWRRFKLFKVFQYSYLTFLTIRLLITAYILKSKVVNLETFALYDSLLGNTALKLSIVDFNLVIAVVPLPLFAIFVDYVGYFHLDTELLLFWKSLFLYQSNQFFAYNAAYQSSTSLGQIRPLKWLVSFARNLKMAWNSPENVHIEQRKLVYIPHLSTTLRIRVLVLYRLFAPIVSLFAFLLCKLSIPKQFN